MTSELRVYGLRSKSKLVKVTLLWLPDQVEEEDEAFSSQLEAASKSQARVLVRDFIYPAICWRSTTEKHK